MRAGDAEPAALRGAAGRDVRAAEAHGPAVAGSDPASTLSSVVFPAPLGPTMPTASSAPSAKSTPVEHDSAPKRFWIPARGEEALSPSRRHGPGSASCTAAACRDRDVLVVGVLGDHEVELELAPGFAFSHCAPMIGVAKTFGTGPLPEVDRCRPAS